MAKYFEGDHYGEEKELTECEWSTGFGGDWRTVKVELGKVYEIQPINPRAKKNRGRQCTALDFELDKIGNPVYTVVKYMDTNRRGRVETTVLVPAK